jgi:hypothetical protein
MKRITFAAALLAALVLSLVIGLSGSWKLAVGVVTASTTLLSLAFVVSKHRAYARLMSVLADSKEAEDWYQDQGMVYLDGKPFVADCDERCSAAN